MGYLNWYGAGNVELVRPDPVVDFPLDPMHYALDRDGQFLFLSLIHI